MTELNEAVAAKVLATVDAGLVHGIGEPVPGRMCVEAAVCYALGQPHGDEPTCVGRAVRAYKIRLNDSGWSSNAARAKGMRRVAIAQLGSDKIDQQAFREYVALHVVRRIVPIAARAAAKLNPSHAGAILALVSACEAAACLPDAQQASLQLRQALRAYAAAADAAAYAADAAYAAYAAYAADAAYAAVAAAYAAYAAYAAAAAAAAAYADAATYAERDRVLTIAAEIAVEALQAQDCEGCQWLHLTEAA